MLCNREMTEKIIENGQDNKTLFIDWLSKKVSSTQLSELYMAFREIEQEAKKVNIVNGSLYENGDSNTYKKLLR